MSNSLKEKIAIVVSISAFVVFVLYMRPVTDSLGMSEDAGVVVFAGILLAWRVYHWVISGKLNGNISIESHTTWLYWLLGMLTGTLMISPLWLMEIPEFIQRIGTFALIAGVIWFFYNAHDDAISKIRRENENTAKETTTEETFSVELTSGISLEKGGILINQNEVLTPNNLVIALEEKYHNLMKDSLKIIDFEEDVDGLLYTDYKSGSLNCLVYDIDTNDNNNATQIVLFYDINKLNDFEIVLFNVSTSDNGILSSYSILEFEDYKQVLYYLNNDKMLSENEITEFKQVIAEYLITNGFDGELNFTGTYLDYFVLDYFNSGKPLLEDEVKEFKEDIINYLITNGYDEELYLYYTLEIYMFRMNNKVYKIIFKDNEIINIKFEFEISKSRIY